MIPRGARRTAASKSWCARVHDVGSGGLRSFTMRATLVVEAVAFLGLALATASCGSSNASDKTPESPATAPGGSTGRAAPAPLDRFRAEVKAGTPRQWIILTAPALDPHERDEWDDYRVG